MMRTRWDFFFEYIGIQFERIHKFKAKIPKELAEAFGLLPEGFEALITIEPDEEAYHPSSMQTGQLKITLPGEKEQTRSLACWMAERMAQQITFSQGEMKVTYGLITGEHLPDTSQEAEQLGDATFFTETTPVEE